MPSHAVGILSLMVWSLVLIVTVKYVLLVMRADNRGEGGILALMALAQRVTAGPRLKATLALVGVIGDDMGASEALATKLSELKSKADNAAELPQLASADLRPIPSIWGHRGLPGGK